MTENPVEALLNARAEIDEQLRRHKNVLTVMFTDVVGSTSYFDRFGDTAGLAMVHLNAELGSTAVREFGGTVVKTIGDSVMADFQSPLSAVNAAIAMQRRLAEINSALTEHRQMQIRIGIHSGMGFRKGTDVFGDVVNLAARITKRTAAGQILISKSVQEAVAANNLIPCQWLDKCTIDGRSEQEDVFEVFWTDLPAYTELRRKLEKLHSDTRVESPHVPKLPARYEVLDKVGQGGMGIVYKARDLQTNEILALKMLKPEVASDAVAQANFNKELFLARKVTHKNVCRIYDLYRNDDVAYASMEYVQGEDLLSILQREGKMPVSKALGIVKQLCSGLGEAHAQGVVHRDLKPANIMVDSNGTVKIMDFGIARMETGVTQTATVVGTPAYMSPEQAEGKLVGARSDIYAVGLIFYEMLTGKATFSGDTVIAIAMKQVAEAPSSPRDLVPSIPREIDSVILKCLEKDPAKRFQSVGELSAALEINLGSTESASHAASAKNTRHFAGKSGSKFKKWSSGIKVPESVDQVVVRLSRTLSKPMPSRIAFGRRMIETRHALILACLMVVAPLSCWIAVKHLKSTLNGKGLAIVSPPVSVLPSDKATHPGKSVPLASYSVATSDESAPLAELNTANVAKSNSEIASDSAPEKTYKPSRHSIVKTAQAPRSSQTTATLPLPLLSSATPVVSLNSPVPSSSDSRLEDVNSSSSASDVSTTEHSPGSSGPTTDRYFDVGSFKEPKWADNASETLEKLGFHTISLHKGRLWMNSYHVIVGPYHDEDAASAARQELELHGFKPKLTKID